MIERVNRHGVGRDFHLGVVEVGCKFEETSYICIATRCSPPSQQWVGVP
jgi:hypothetical protein